MQDYCFDPTQTWLAVVGQTALQIFHWANGKLTSSGTFPMPCCENLLRWDHAGHLFVMNTNADQTNVYVFNVVNGVPTPAPGSPYLIPGLLGNGLAVKPLP